MRHNRRARHKRAKKRSRRRDWRFWSYRRRGVEMATKMAFLRMEAQLGGAVYCLITCSYIPVDSNSVKLSYHSNLSHVV